MPWVLRVRQSLAVDWAPEQVRSRARPALPVPRVMERVTDGKSAARCSAGAQSTRISSTLRTDCRSILQWSATLETGDRCHARPANEGRQSLVKCLPVNVPVTCATALSTFMHYSKSIKSEELAKLKVLFVGTLESFKINSASAVRSVTRKLNWTLTNPLNWERRIKLVLCPCGTLAKRWCKAQMI